jgi:hypothetical protein
LADELRMSGDFIVATIGDAPGWMLWTLTAHPTKRSGTE